MTGGFRARRWLALGAVMLGVLVAGLDVTVLSVALPTLAVALHASESDLQWFSSGYAVVLAAAMLPAGVLGDRFGRRRVMLGALALFAAGSVACAYSTTPALFIAARLILGAAAAFLIVMALSVLAVLFTEEERPRAIGVWAAANFLSVPVGPILGGWLLAHFWWGWVFLLNVPVAALGAIAIAAVVPESRSERPPALDPLGMLAGSAGLVGVTYGLIELGRNGWTDRLSLAGLAGGLVVLAGFFAWERRLSTRGRALIDLSLFASPAYTWGIVLAGLAVFAMVGVLFTMPQYSQGVLGLDAQGSGIRLLPMVLGLVVGAVPADRIVRAAGPGLTAAAGFAVVAAGMLAGSTTGTTSSAGFVAAWMFVVGAGMGVGLATAASAALSGIPAQRSGVASAVMQALQKAGAPLGSAVLGSVLVTGYQSALSVGGLPAGLAGLVQQSVFGGVAVAGAMHSAALLEEVRRAFVLGMDQSLLVSAGIALVAAVVAAALLPRRAAAAAGSKVAGGEVVG